MNALERIHAALGTGGLLIDTQPVSSRPVVETDAGELGTLDMREWTDIIASVDRQVEQVIEAGLFALESEHRHVVTDAYDDGPEMLADVRGWMGTHVDPVLTRDLEGCGSPVRLHQDVRLRVLRVLELV